MVNDQLIRIHHLRLLSQEKLTPRSDESTQSSEPSSPKLSPTFGCPRTLSSSAPESTFTNRIAIDAVYVDDDDSVARDADKSEHTSHDSDSISIHKRPVLKDETRKPRKRAQQLSKSQNSSPIRSDHFVKSLKKQDSNDSGSGKRSSTSSKRRSSWRHLLSPSYKTRSDEFHKIFCDEIPKNERLVADYSCALHREILIQGRIYVSINYIAFYSNLFSWITKLVIRLRDVAEIYKANTVRIIPNAIQFVTKTGDKHVFASFLARDKSYIMILRIWRNNLLKDRMTDQEIRTLVHCGYGKDLGMSDNEELKINSPDPKTPANVTSADKYKYDSLDIQNKDGNNNSNRSNNSDILEEDLEPPPQPAPSPLDLSDEFFSMQSLYEDKGTSHTRYNSIDYQLRMGKQDLKNNDVANELLKKLSDLFELQKPIIDESGYSKLDNLGDQSQTNSPLATSTVVVDTPDSVSSTNRRHSRGSDTTNATESKLATINDIDEHQKQQDLHGKSSSRETLIEKSVESAANEVNSSNDNAIIQQKPTHSKQSVTSKQVDCDCKNHEGQVVADHNFDLDVEDLFALIFMNPNFMRAHMSKRGLIGTMVISKWKRSKPNGGDKSNSSTLSRDEQRNIPPDMNESSVKPTPVVKQSRQLIYSLKINHILAKQVKVTENQEISSMKAGQYYVLKSVSVNSGIPYAETFTMDMRFCLSKLASRKSRLLVHCIVNFKKEHHGWKLAMIKSTIEKSSLAGVVDYMNDLISAIKDYTERKQRKKRVAECGQKGNEIDSLSIDRRSHLRVPSGGSPVSRSLICNDSSASSSAKSRRDPKQAMNDSAGTFQSTRLVRSQSSLARVKSKLKEKKLKSMYKYYIRDRNEDLDVVNGLAIGDDMVFSQDDNYKSSLQSSQNKHLGLAPSDDADDDSSIGGSTVSSDDDEEDDINPDDGSILLASDDDDDAGDNYDNGSMMMMMTHDSDSEASCNSGAAKRYRGKNRGKTTSTASLSMPSTTTSAIASTMSWLFERLLTKDGLLLLIVVLLLIIVLGLGRFCFVILGRLDSIEASLQHKDCVVRRQQLQG